MSLTININPGGNMAGYVNDRWCQATKKHPHYEKLLQAVLANDTEAFIEAYDQAAVTFSCERSDISEPIEITKESITYRGRTITDPTVIAVIKSYGTQCDALKRFVDNLFLNPQWESVQQLGAFLRHNNFPLTEDGCFLGYKAVRPDWMDQYSGTIKNAIGAEIHMPRERVTFDPEAACSAGLHVGTHAYAVNYGGSSSRLLIVKVNPAHCVSVPYDANCQKLRCSQYKVLAECDGVLPMGVVYDMDGTQVRADNWFADVRAEEVARKRRPSPEALRAADICAPTNTDINDDARYVCATCGWAAAVDEFDEDVNFCPTCGGNVEAEKPKEPNRYSCDNCGWEAYIADCRDEVSYCPYCGSETELIDEDGNSCDRN